MTNALVFHVASGQALFSGSALIALAALLAWRKAGRRAGLVRTTTAGLWLALIAASATPLPAGFYAIAGEGRRSAGSGSKVVRGRGGSRSG